MALKVQASELIQGIQAALEGKLQEEQTRIVKPIRLPTNSGHFPLFLGCLSLSAEGKPSFCLLEPSLLSGCLQMYEAKSGEAKNQNLSCDVTFCGSEYALVTPIII